MALVKQPKTVSFKSKSRYDIVAIGNLERHACKVSHRGSKQQ